MYLLGTGKQRAGKTSRIEVGDNTFLSFASWTLALVLADLPTPNFNSYDVNADQTFDEGISGILGCDIRSGGDWDAGINPLDDPPGLFPRDDAGPLKYYTSRLDAVNWDFPYARLRGTNNSADVAGKVAFDFSGKNQGPFTYPTGSV